MKITQEQAEILHKRIAKLDSEETRTQLGKLVNHAQTAPDVNTTRAAFWIGRRIKVLEAEGVPDQVSTAEQRLSYAERQRLTDEREQKVINAQEELAGLREALALIKHHG